MDSKQIVSYIKHAFGITYTPQGLVHLLHRIGFVYKKSKHVPGKADPQKQKDFLEETYWKTKKKMGENDRLYFADATHPLHNSMPSYGWIPKGKVSEVPSNTGRKRLNINGAIDIADLDFQYRTEETVNADSMIDLFRQMEQNNPDAQHIYVIMDNARYNRAKKLKEYMASSKIEPIYLPPYSPNLNLIERLWRFVYKKIQYNRYYETFDAFKKACCDLLNGVKDFEQELRSLLTEKFQILGENISPP